jgi:predicted nucleic acid-binding protein
VDEEFARDVEAARSAVGPPGGQVATALIDGSVLIDAERRGNALEERLGDDVPAISVITVSELLHGVRRADSEPRRLARQAFVEQLLARLMPVPGDRARIG